MTTKLIPNKTGVWMQDKSGEVYIIEDISLDEVILYVNSHEALLNACKKQHDAIDYLFALLIEKDRKFRPSKSFAWGACLEGNEAIRQAEEK